MNVMVVAFGVLIMLLFIGLMIPQDEQQKEPPLEDNYSKPQLKPLTAEQIEDIHKRGKITAAEKVKEWESLDLCAPGDAIGSAGWRCKKFRHNCHDCLVDYASDHDEYTSVFDELVIRNPYIAKENKDE